MTRVDALRKKRESGNPTDPDAVWSIYYVGIIDVLQRYDFSKKMEHFFKANVRCMDAHGISAVSVQEYATRFLQAMDKYFVWNAKLRLFKAGFLPFLQKATSPSHFFLGLPKI